MILQPLILANSMAALMALSDKGEPSVGTRIVLNMICLFCPFIRWVEPHTTMLGTSEKRILDVGQNFPDGWQVVSIRAELISFHDAYFARGYSERSSVVCVSAQLSEK